MAVKLAELVQYREDMAFIPPQDLAASVQVLAP
jgi:hypothetical protein